MPVNQMRGYQMGMRTYGAEENTYAKNQTGKNRRNQQDKSSEEKSPGSVVQGILNPLPKAHCVNGTKKMSLHGDNPTLPLTRLYTIQSQWSMVGEAI
jgi:hypothetical protein